MSSRKLCPVLPYLELELIRTTSTLCVYQPLKKVNQTPEVRSLESLHPMVVAALEVKLSLLFLTMISSLFGAMNNAKQLQHLDIVEPFKWLTRAQRLEN